MTAGIGPLERRNGADREHRRVTIGTGEEDDHELAAPDRSAGHHGVVECQPAGELDGESSRRISSTAFRPQ